MVTVGGKEMLLASSRWRPGCCHFTAHRIDPQGKIILSESRAEAETTCPGRRHEYNHGVGKAFVTRTENLRHSKRYTCV